MSIFLIKGFIFLIDMLNIIYFNIFNMLKLIFKCKTYTISKKLGEKYKVSILLYLFAWFITFILFLKAGQLFIYFIFCCLYLTLFFNLFHEIIVLSMYFDMIKLLCYDPSYISKPKWILLIVCRKFCDSLTWLNIISNFSGA